MRKLVKRVSALFLVMAAMVSMGCDDKAPVEETTTGVTDITEAITTTESSGEITDAERGEGQIISIGGSEDAQRLGVDKVVVFVLDAAAFPRKEGQIARFNELLVNKYGCDFVVEFRGYTSYPMPAQKNYTHYEMVMDMKNMGHRTDILYCGHSGDYSRFVEAGIYEPLNDYFATDEGKQLYEAYAPEIWKKTERDGLIYGYMSDIYPSGSAYSLCNTELAAKYGVTVPEGEWSFYDVGRYLEVAGVTQDNMAADEVLLSGVSEGLLLLEGYTTGLIYQGEHIYFKTDGDNGWIAVDLSKEDDFLKLVKTIKEYSDKGWYSCNEDGRVDQYVDVREGRFVFSFTAMSSAGVMYMDNKYVGSENNIIHNVTCGKVTYEANFLMENMVSGVTTWAEYKEEALKLLTLINTEAELSNLLNYGIEGVHYVYKDRLADYIHKPGALENPVSASYLANMNLLHPVLIDPEDKLAYSKQVSANYPDGPDMLYDIDMSTYKEQLQAIGSVYEEYIYKLFRAQYEDVDAAVKEMGTALAAAGIDEVISELNRQMKGQ